MATTSPTEPAVDRLDPLEDDEAVRSESPSTRVLGWVLLVCGLIGALAAAVLTIEKIALVGDPNYIPSCNINPILSCGSVMITDQAEAFGFPNPLMGLAGFPAIAATGAALLAGGRFARWYWLLLQAGVTFGVVFAHWLVFQSMYRIGALCPYCMVVWVVTITAFTYVTLANLDRFVRPGQRRPVLDVLVRLPGTIVAVWLAGIAALALVRFWDNWVAMLS
jgi:uncharacterized membrane protein